MKSAIKIGCLFLGLVLSQTVLGIQKKSPEVTDLPPRRTPPVPAKTVTGTLVLFTDPPESDVFLNQKSQGKTTAAGNFNQPLSLKPGSYVLEVKHPDYEPLQQSVTIRPGSVTPLRVALRPRFGIIQLVFSQPFSNGTIKLDGNEISASDLTRTSETEIRLKTPIGHHRLEILGAEYLPFSGEITLRGATPQSLPVILERAVAALLIKTQEGTRVYVNGQETGIVPATGALRVSTLLPDQPNTVRLERFGYEKFEQLIRGQAGKTVELEPRLLPLPTTTEFADNFQGGLQFWEAPSEWKAETGILTVPTTSRIGVVKEKRFCESEVFFGLRLTNDRGAAWVVRAQDEKNYYLFCLNGPGGIFPNKFQTYVCRDGKLDLTKPVTAPLPILPPLKPGETYRVHIKISGNTIQHWITPSKTGEEISIGFFQDAQNTFPCGTLGFSTPAGEAFQVTGFVVSPLSAN